MKTNFKASLNKQIDLRLNSILKDFCSEFIYFIARYLDIYIFDISTISYKSEDEKQLFNVFIKEVGKLPYLENSYLNFIKYVKTFLYEELEGERQYIVPEISNVFIAKNLKKFIENKINEIENRLSISVDQKQFSQLNYETQELRKKQEFYKLLYSILENPKDAKANKMWEKDLRAIIEHKFTDIDDFKNIKTLQFLEEILSSDLQRTAGSVRVVLEVREEKDKFLYKNKFSGKTYELSKKIKPLYLNGIDMFRQNKIKWYNYTVDRIFRMYNTKIIPDISNYILLSVLTNNEVRSEGFMLTKRDILRIIKENSANHFKAYLGIYKHIFDNIGASILKLPTDLIFDMYSFVPELHFNSFIKR